MIPIQIIIGSQKIQYQIIRMAQQSPNDIADIHYQQILSIKGITLESYKGTPPHKPLLQNATVYPEFFNDNLVSQYRIIKEFINDPHGNIRIFYFQLLRLSYEIEPNNSDYRGFIINLRRMVFAPDFQIMFTPETESQREIFSDFQFKKFFAEFLVIMQNSTNTLVEHLINKYPIIDLVFIHIFRSLLAARGVNEPFEVRINTEVVFGQFAQPLGLNITSYGNCWKFQDSDMFCYEEDQQKLYLAYIVQAGSVQAEATLINQKIGAIPTETVHTTYIQTLPVGGSTYTQTISTTYVSPTHTTYTTQIPTPVTSYATTEYHTSPTVTTTYNTQSYTTDPLIGTSYTSSIPVVTTSYQVDPLAGTSSYTLTQNVSSTPAYTGYTPLTTSYESTSNPITTYETTSYTTPTSSYSSETYTSSYSSSQPYTSTYDYKPLVSETINYTLSNDVNDLVNKYLSGNVGADLTSPSSYSSSSYTNYGSSAYTPTPVTTTTTTVEQKTSTPTEAQVEYISYTPVTTPIEIKTETPSYGATNSYASYTSPYSTPQTTTYKPTDYGVGGGYLGGSTSFNYQPTTYSTSTTSNYGQAVPENANATTFTSHYDSYGKYASDFSNNDILNIMKRGSGAQEPGKLTTVGTVEGVTSSYHTGPITTVSPTGTSTYEYSSSYTVNPSGTGYSASSSSSSYSAQYSTGTTGGRLY